ncbi:MAG: peptidoglycan recognition family protein [Cyanobacteriota bacterium]|nr:peptidoglycan recognition family protein [Cyanobacteriota bacterium]
MTPDELRGLAEGLLAAARRRGLGSEVTLAQIQRALPQLLTNQPQLLAALQAQLRNPSCLELLSGLSLELRLAQIDQLLRDQRPAGGSLLQAQRAFLEGLARAAGKPAAARPAPAPSAAAPAAVAPAAALAPAAAARKPDLRSWLMGLATGAGVALALAFLVQVGLRGPERSGFVTGSVPAPPDASSAPGTPASQPAPTDLPPSDLAALDSRLSQCRQVAPPSEEQQQPAASTHFGERVAVDAEGRSIPSRPALIVLHETVIDLPSTIRLFQNASHNDAAQASYHVLIGRQGQRVRVVADANRAYGAGDSAFGDFRLRTSATNPPSINNVALHVSLETPADGRGDGEAHSGYTTAQYQALAAQVLRWQALYGIPMERVTTHAAVDRSRSRYDPRSFRWDLFDQAYAAVRKTCA